MKPASTWRSRLMGAGAILFGWSFLAGAGPDYVRASTFGGGGSLGTHVARVAVNTDGDLFFTGEIHDSTDFDPGPGQKLLRGPSSAFVASWSRDHTYRWAVEFGDIADTHAKKAEGFSIAVDGGRRVYVCGEILGVVDMNPGPATNNLDGNQGGAFVSCFSAAEGQLLWTRVVDDWYREIAYDVAADTNHGVYYAGMFGSERVDFDPTGGVDFKTNATYPSYANAGFVSKLGDDGSYRWTRTFSGGTYVGCYCYGVAVTPAGWVYATGKFGSTVDFDDGTGTVVRSAPQTDAFLVALGPDGALRWVRTWGGASTSEGVEVAVSDDGVFVAGDFYGSVDFDPGPGTDIRSAAGGSHYVVRYSHAGDYQWVYTLPAEYETKEVHFSPGLATDSRGNAFFTSRYDNKRGGVDFDNGPASDVRTGPGIFLTRINADGGYAWTACMTQTVSSITSQGNGVAIDLRGNAVIVGTFEGGIDFDPGAGVDIHTTSNYFQSFVSTLANAGVPADYAFTPAWWLAQYGFTNRNWDVEAQDDQDGDGMRTWQEWYADTDPTRAASVLKITGIVPSADGTSIEWQGGTSVWQYLERNMGLGTGTMWTSVFSNGPVTAPSASFLDTTATNSAWFYRIKAER